MNFKIVVLYFLFAVSVGLFIYGFVLFFEASQPCGSDGCMIHILYLIAIPMILIFGITSFKLYKYLFTKKNKK